MTRTGELRALFAGLVIVIAITFASSPAGGTSSLSPRRGCNTALTAKRVSSILDIPVKLEARTYKQGPDTGYACLYSGRRHVRGFSRHKYLVEIVLRRDRRDAATTPNIEGYTPLQNGATATTIRSLSAYETTSQAGHGITVSTGRWWVSVFMRYPEYTNKPPYDDQTADGYVDVLTPEVVRHVTTSHMT